MMFSPTITELSKALVKAQSKMGAAVKGSSNPYFKSKYSDLNSVIEACKEHLNSEGITVLQPVSSDDTGDYVETILLHTSGEYISSKMKLRTQKENDMQAYGSAISYARRYGLQSMVFVPSSEDDDAESSMNRTKKGVDVKKSEATKLTTILTESKPVELAPEVVKELSKPKSGFASYKREVTSASGTAPEVQVDKRPTTGNGLF